MSLVVMILVDAAFLAFAFTCGWTMASGRWPWERRR